MYVCGIFFIHSSDNRHFKLLPHLGYCNNAALNVRIRLPQIPISFTSDIYTKMGLVDHIQ